MLHGQQPAGERRLTMDRFRAGEVQVLVATTVIEVGVDVPNAVLMVIEEADRFGLAQLHQLRGRVGRGAHESFCVLIADPVTEDAEHGWRRWCGRPTASSWPRSTSSCAARAPSWRHGRAAIPDLRHARLSKHRRLAELAREEARRFLDDDPELRSPAAELIEGEARRSFGDDLDWLTTSVRIVAGEKGGRRISAPRGAVTRPTGDRVREALFSILGDIEGAEVLDAFAGSGALGLEALSRGAATATFWDTSTTALRALRSNIEALDYGDGRPCCAATRAVRWRRTRPPAGGTT